MVIALKNDTAVIPSEKAAAYMASLKKAGFRCEIIARDAMTVTVKITSAT
jgi:hypothetical protein